MEAAILYLVLYTLHVEFWNHTMGTVDTRNEVVSYVPPVLNVPVQKDGSKLMSVGTVYLNELAWNEQYRMKDTVRHVTLKDYRVLKIDLKRMTIDPYTVEQEAP